MDTEILPVKSHIRALIDGEAHENPCDDCGFEDLETKLPPWYDEAKFKRGQKFIRNNLFAQFTATFCGMICVLVVPSILTILLKTHRSSTVLGAYRRYFSTSLHLNSWYFQDLKPGTTAWRSLTTVRVRHLRSSRTSQKRGDGHISQRDLVLGQFGFVGLGLIRPKFLGIYNTNSEDLEAYTHFWRTIGYLIGIKDKYNLCRPSLEETIEVTNAVCTEIYQPLFRDPPEFFYYMVSIMIQGMWYLSPTVSEGSFLYFTYRLIGVEGFNYNKEEEKVALLQKKEALKARKSNGLKGGFRSVDNKKINSGKKVAGDEFYEELGWYNRTMLFALISVCSKVMSTCVGRLYFNFKIYFSFLTSQYFPYMLFWRFGIKKAYVNMFQEDLRTQADPKTNKEMLALRKF